MFYITAVSTLLRKNFLYYRECSTIEEAHELNDLLKMYNDFNGFEFAKIKIKNIPYDTSEGFYSNRLSDSTIKYIKMATLNYIRYRMRTKL